MRWTKSLTHRIRTLLGRDMAARELDEEIRYHIELDTRRNIEAGMTPIEARRQAMLRFGSVENAKEEVRDESGVRWFEDLLSDVRFALRSLRKTPVFTAAALISLGVGIGANTAIFSVVNGVLLEPLPYPASDELFVMQIDWPTFDGPLSDADFLRISEMQENPASFAAFGRVDFTMSTPEGPEIVIGARVTEAMFDVLGVSPVVGRSFMPDDESVVIISYEFWQTRFSGAADVLSRTLELDDGISSIIGVLPPSFRLPRRTDGEIFALYRIAEPSRRGPFYLRGFVRLGASEGAAVYLEHLAAVTAHTKNQHPQGTDDWEYEIRPLKDVVVGNADVTLMLLFAAVGCVLIIAVANVANLVLARGSSREGEVALRSALGANTNRLVRLMLTESAVLGTLGAALGIGLAWVCSETLSYAAAAFLPRMDSVALDGRVLAFALVVGIVSGLVVGVVPALSVPWKKLSQKMCAGARGGVGGSRRGGLRKALVIAEFALALTVLLASGLMIRSLRRMQTADLGFEHDNIVAFRLTLPADPYANPEEFDAFFASLEERLESVPGVSSVGYATAVPPDRLSLTNNYTVESQEPTQGGVQPVCPWLATDEAYFETLGIPIRRGRTFDSTDRSDGPEVVVVNEAFERFHFPGESAVGKRLKGGAWDAAAPWMTIIGVVGDVTYRGLHSDEYRTVYMHHPQAGRWRVPWVVVRHEQEAGLLTPSIRREMVALDASVPMYDVWTMDQLVRESTSNSRSLSALFSVLAFVALALAATGIYGVISYHVSTQRHEIAIRQALGSPSASVIGQVLKEGLVLAVVGVALGTGGAYLLARGLQSLLYEVSATDLTTYAGTTLILTVTAIVACLIPSIRASRVDPVSALREE